MKKIVFVTILMQNRMQKAHYPAPGNVSIEYPGELYYPINGVIAKNLTADDEVKVCLISRNVRPEVNSIEEENMRLFEEELNSLNTCGAKIEYKRFSTEFVETKQHFEELFEALIETLEYDAVLYADTTYGPRTSPTIIINVMQFGEKFFNCEIGNCIYIKAEFDKDKKIIPEKTSLYDITALYYLGDFVNTIECSSGEKAVAAVKQLFSKS